GRGRRGGGGGECVAWASPRSAREASWELTGGAGTRKSRRSNGGARRRHYQGSTPSRPGPHQDRPSRSSSQSGHPLDPSTPCAWVLKISPSGLRVCSSISPSSLSKGVRVDG